jgi:hypothetical protein
MQDEEIYQSPLSTHLFIDNYLRDLSVIPSRKRSEGDRVKPVHPRWIPPQPGCVRLNVDAAMAKTTTGGVVGVVCRSALGEFMGASALTIPGITDPAVMEALACREAMALAKDLNLQNIMVATDCLSVITAMEQPYAGRFSMVHNEVKDDASLFPVFRLDMKIGHQTLMIIGWHVFLFLVKLDVRFSSFSPLMVFVSRTMSLINKVP